MKVSGTTVGGKIRFELRNSFLMASLLVVQFLTIALSSPIEYRQYNFVKSGGDGAAGPVSDGVYSTMSLGRVRRDLRSSRKIDSSSMPIAMMPAYYPFIMAEMMAGSVQTRHPSIVAINGCPAYYIADHSGKCRQVFQYTVNFGQPAYRYQPATYVPPTRTQNPWFPSASRTFSRPNPHSASQHPKPSPVPKPVSTGPKGGISHLLRDAAKRFDLSFLQRQSTSSSSGEQKDPAALSSLREQILAALKIPSKNKGSKKSAASNNPKYQVNDITATPDYDD